MLSASDSLFVTLPIEGLEIHMVRRVLRDAVLIRGEIGHAVRYVQKNVYCPEYSRTLFLKHYSGDRFHTTGLPICDEGVL